MSWITRAVCEICNRQKGEVNHWTLYSVTKLDRCIVFRPWDEELAGSAEWGHLCSEECSQKMLDRFQSGVKTVKQVREQEAASVLPTAKPDLEYVLVTAESSCEYCGPHCYHGAAHNARVEDGTRYAGGAK